MSIIRLVRAKLGKNSTLKNILHPIGRWLYKREKKKKNKLFRKNGEKVFGKVLSVSRENGLTIWPEFGTLLGIYRDHGFIKHDIDLDFGAFAEDADKIKQVFISSGMKLIMEYRGVKDPQKCEMTFCYNNLDFDLFFFQNTADNTVCYTFDLLDVNIRNGNETFKMKPFRFPAFTLCPFTFNNQTLLIPQDIDTHLKYAYGENYMIPDPNFTTIHHEYIIGEVAECKREH